MCTQYERMTDAQWEVIKPFVNWQRKRKYNLRDIFDAIFYITRSGTQWRNLPKDIFPKWESVYYYFRKWKNDGTIEKINLAINQLERLKIGREISPSLGFVDSQSIKLAPMIGYERGLDGNKKVNGRKRHILTDVIGRIYTVHVHAANRHDSPQGVHLLDDIDQLPRLECIMADKTYQGTFARAVEALGLRFEVPERPQDTKGFVVEAKRWVVERSFAWLNFFRRVVKDYERTTESAQTFVLIANITMGLQSLFR